MVHGKDFFFHSQFPIPHSQKAFNSWFYSCIEMHPPKILPETPKYRQKKGFATGKNCAFFTKPLLSIVNG
jgi:hypothetical protein